VAGAGHQPEELPVLSRNRLAGDKLRQALVQLGIDLAHDVLLRALSL
jgi:hypothetical protein